MPQGEFQRFLAEEGPFDAALVQTVMTYWYPGVREVIDPASGLLVQRGDVSALIATLRRLLRDPTRCRAVGHACRDHVNARFSEDDVVARLREFYAKLLADAA